MWRSSQRLTDGPAGSQKTWTRMSSVVGITHLALLGELAYLRPGAERMLLQ
jgi:hypothetical protein